MLDVALSLLSHPIRMTMRHPLSVSYGGWPPGFLLQPPALFDNSPTREGFGMKRIGDSRFDSYDYSDS